MILDFRSCIYRNEWSFKGRLTSDFEEVQETQCFSNLTIHTMRSSTKIDNCVFKMYFNTLEPYKTFRGKPYSNISFFSLDQYREYIQLVQDYIPKFTWELIEAEKELINLIGQKHCIVLNMKNINIAERKRELATLKVLGFYDNEVSAYVYRENNPDEGEHKQTFGPLSNIYLHI